MQEIDITKLWEFQESFFEKAGDLYENIEQLGNEFYNLQLADLIKIYKLGSEALIKTAELEHKIALYEIECKENLTTPGRRRWLFWKRNEPADIIFREINVDVTKAFRARTEVLERLEAALEKADSADKRTTAFDEPLAPQDEPEPEQGETSEISDKNTTSARACTTTEPQTNETKAKTKQQNNGQVPGQMTLDDVQANAKPQEPTAANTTFSAKSEKAVPPPRTNKSK